MSDTLTQTPVADSPQVPATTEADARRHPTIRRSLAHEMPYILMLVLGLAGATFHLSMTYWVALTPFFGIISIITGWHNFPTAASRLTLIYSQVLIWCALVVAIYVLYASGTQGLTLALAANPLTLVTLLALGTFVAGVQARAWQTCAVGIVLFLAVPGISWIGHSLILLVGLSVVVVIIGALTWSFAERRRAA